MAVLEAEQYVSMDERRSLVLAAARGDKAAFAQLYDQFASRVYNLVLRSVRHPQAAEDVCQETWVRAYQKLSELREPAAFSTWLYRIASRACIDRARRPAVEEELPEQFPAPAQDGPEDATIRLERERLLWQALGALPVRQHLALFLREIEEQNYKEIASILDTSESAVETLLFRARRGIAEAFERLEGAGARCGQAKRTMAVIIDGEATHVQRRAVQAHADECRSCRVELGQFRKASAAYGVLPMLPVPLLLAGKIFGGLGAAAAAGGSAGAIGKLIGLLSTKATMATAALTVTAGMTVATLAVPGDTSRTTLAGAQAPVAASTTQPANITNVEQPSEPSGSGLATQGQPPAAVATSVIDALHQLGHTVTATVGQPALEQLLNAVATATDGTNGVGVVPSVATPAVPAVVPSVTPPLGIVPGITPPLPLPTIAPPTLPPLPLP